MSMDLYLWKSPVTDDEEEARKLVDLYFERQEQGVFAPSADIAAAADELLRLYPIWKVSGPDLVAAMSEKERSQYSEQGLAELLESGSYDQAEDGPWSDIAFRPDRKSAGAQHPLERRRQGAGRHRSNRARAGAGDL